MASAGRRRLREVSKMELSEHDYLERMFGSIFWNIAVMEKAFPENPAVKQCTAILRKSIEEHFSDYKKTAEYERHLDALLTWKNLD